MFSKEWIDERAFPEAIDPAAVLSRERDASGHESAEVAERMPPPFDGPPRWVPNGTPRSPGVEIVRTFLAGTGETWWAIAKPYTCTVVWTRRPGGEWVRS